MVWPFSKRSGQDASIGMVLDPLLGGSAAVVQRRGSRLQLLHSASCPAPADGLWGSLLGHLLGEHTEPLNIVAPAGSYQLLLVDRPDVPKTELAAAVRWKIRDLLTGPVDDSVVDVFEVPSQARGSRNMIYAVAAPGESIRQVSSQIDDCPAPIGSIDIAELCMRNIATHLEQDRFGVALLLVRGSHGILTITRDKRLYVIRQMEIPAGVGDGQLPAEAMSSIALELQRSLDYFESHYDQRPIRDVVLAPSAESATLFPALARELAVNVSLLDLNQLLETPEELSVQQQADCLLAIGAALRGPDHLEQAA
ncbi:MAG: hypothetical protein KJO35_00710 [Gammaproteobacteria bacterium]|nr:hypothetical protein [Gammaproteobacteria bacterium]